jgi:hypothetical protein
MPRPTVGNIRPKKMSIRRVMPIQRASSPKSSPKRSHKRQKTDFDDFDKIMDSLSPIGSVRSLGGSPIQLGSPYGSPKSDWSPRSLQFSRGRKKSKRSKRSRSIIKIR